MSLTILHGCEVSHAGGKLPSRRAGQYGQDSGLETSKHGPSQYSATRAGIFSEVPRSEGEANCMD